MITTDTITTSEEFRNATRRNTTREEFRNRNKCHHKYYNICNTSTSSYFSNNPTKVTVIDSLMGAGKTTWAKEELLEKQYDTNFLYITPYLDDIDAMTRKNYNQVNLKRNMVQPRPMGKTKLDSIAYLLENNFDIVSTHSLFRKFDDRCMEALEANKYTLILDEALSAVEPYIFAGKEDFEFLIKENLINIENDGTINWIGFDYKTRFDDVKTLANNKCLFQVKDRYCLWCFPPKIFSLFDKVYIMTYMFEGSLMKYYFDLNNISYEKKSIKKNEYGKYKLVEYCSPDKTNIRNRINIYKGNMNFDYLKTTAFSATWFKEEYNRETIEQLKNNFYNYAQNINKAKSKDVMWTTFKDYKNAVKPKGYTRDFVSCNCVGTNDYKDKTCLMYGCNRYENPMTLIYFYQNGINVDQNALALCTLLQWIWRSNIRIADSDKQINIYIPSKRMRGLLEEWLLND